MSGLIETPEPWTDAVAVAQASIELLAESPAAQWDVAPDPIAVMETPVVSEADIAALIAEADRLEAAEESEAAEAALVLEAEPESGHVDDEALELALPGLHLVETAPRVGARRRRIGRSRRRNGD